MPDGVRARRSAPGLERISSSGRRNTETTDPLHASGESDFRSGHRACLQHGLYAPYRHALPESALRLDAIAGGMPRSAAENRREGAGTATTTETLVVRLENISKRYDAGGEILHDVSLALEPGGFYFVTGASGTGKTTLLKIIYLAELPSHGVVKLFGSDTASLNRAGRAALRRRTGIVFQDFRLIDEFSVAENVALPLRIAGAPEAEIRERVASLLDWLGLEHPIDANATLLSSSERQRVAIARAIVTRPDLLIADEPTSHVDDEIASLLVRVFERVNQLGTTVLVATRDIGFARRFEHPRLHLDRGALRTIEAAAQ